MKKNLLKEMFDKVVVNKDASLIPEYYSEAFLLYSNGQEINYKDFLEMHKEIYKTAIEYSVQYDEETLLEQGDKVAGRVWITTKLPNENPKEIEVLLIALYKDKKIYRLWEVTYPDWKTLAAFNEGTKKIGLSIS